ncbi:MAG: DNA translocase FtsK 4TM domain-containing protein [Phycisphaerae bacterium]
MSAASRVRAVRSVGLLASLALCAVAWIALLTFDPYDWPSPAAWPVNVPTQNACGRFGSFLAYVLIHYLGDGSYPMLLFVTVAAIARLTRDAISDLPLRLIGMTLLVAVTSATVALIAPQPSGGLPIGNGGVLGVAVLALLGRFSALWTAVILFFSFIVGLLLAADDLVLRAPIACGWLRQQIRGVAALLMAPVRRLALAPVAAPHLADDGEPAARQKLRAAIPATPPRGLARTLVAGTLGRPAPGETAEPRRGATDPRAGGAPAAVAEPPAAPRPPIEVIVRNIAAPAKKASASPWPKELGDYVLPPLSLLRDPDYSRTAAHETMVRELGKTLERALNEFRIEGRVVEIDTGPVITLFEVELAPGVKVGQISALSNDIARALRAPVVRVVPTLPGKNTIGIEVPNLDKEKVRLKELIMLAGPKATKAVLPVFLGKDASGNPLIADIAGMPHLLIAGTTGSGKSVCINTLIMSFLLTQRPDHVKLILIDPKMVELSVFKDVPHLMCPIVTDMQRAERILDWAATKMDERYELLSEAGVKNIESFNRLGKEEIYARFQPSDDSEKAQIPTHLPYIVIIIDELADLMMTSGKEVEHHLARLAQKSRAVGIHLIVATQRPQANVVTGLIKSNLPCRIAFRVASRMDSRIVLDQNGAELLMGQGDMLFLPPGSAKLLRSQGTFVEEDELKATIDDLRAKAAPEFHHELQRLRGAGEEESGERDPLFDQAVDIVVETQRGSVSLLQRRLEVGYSRASRLIDQMAAAGLVGEYKGSQAREVIVTGDEWEAIKEQRNAEEAAAAARSAATPADGGEAVDWNAGDGDSDSEQS